MLLKNQYQSLSPCFTSSILFISQKLTSDSANSCLQMTLFLILTIVVVWITFRVSQDVRYDTDDLRALLQATPVAGEDLYASGWRSHHPVVLVPGIVSGGLVSFHISLCFGERTRFQGEHGFFSVSMFPGSGTLAGRGREPQRFPPTDLGE